MSLQNDETLLAIETLVNGNCLTLAQALEMAYKSGHRKAVKELTPTQLTVMPGWSDPSKDVTSTTSNT